MKWRLNFGDITLSFISALMKEIKINDKKKQLMEKITLYNENKINSYDLFESSI